MDKLNIIDKFSDIILQMQADFLSFKKRNPQSGTIVPFEQRLINLNEIYCFYHKLYFDSDYYRYKNAESQKENIKLQMIISEQQREIEKLKLTLEGI